jgi:hypothetical protein
LATGIKIKALNRMLQQEHKEAEDELKEVKELKERWYTNAELQTMQERQGG